MIEAGLMRSDELKCMDSLNEKCNVNKWWMPLVWATNIVNRARQENRLKSDPGMQTVLQEISNIRHGLTSVQHFDTLSVPLVYTQVGKLFQVSISELRIQKMGDIKNFFFVYFK